MRNLFSTGRFHAFFTSILLLGAVSTALADDRFSIAVGQHGDLLVFGPKGEKVADFPVPSISQPVTVNGATSFNVSYGRDENNRLTAILAPNAAQPEDLHFTVLGKAVDADKAAVVTVTFSRNLNSVSIDPGYVGVVEVNSTKVRHHDLADDSYAPATTPRYEPVSTSPENAYSPAPAPRMNTDVAPRDLPPASRSTDNSVTTSESMAPSTDITATGAPSDKHLFWSEPVTDPRGNAPHVGVDQMKLVEVQGSVSVRTPGGEVRDGADGMIVPSGSVVSTSDGSSAAIFIGGVDSVRLLPNTDVAVSQHFEGAVRHATVDLQKGTAFSRVGKRAGEIEKFEVHTPQGTAMAKGTEFCVTIHGNSVYVFTEKGSVGLYVANQFLRDIDGNGGGNIGIGSFGPGGDGAQVLREVLLALQPFNAKTNLVLLHVHRGTATSEELAYYTAAIYGALLEEGYPPGYDAYLAAQVGAAVTVGLHDLLPFQTPPMTKF